MSARLTERFSALLRRGSDAPHVGGRVSARALFAAFFFCGIFAGYGICSALESSLMSAALDADRETARFASRRAPSFANAGQGGGVDGFTAENPFGADLRAVKEAETSRSVKAAPETLKSMMLRGTLPGAGAWIEISGSTRFVLKGQTVEGFTLSDVKYSEALLSDGAGEHSLYLILSGGARPAASNSRQTRRANTRRRTPTPAPQPQEKPALDFSGLEPASEGQEGAVPRELVDALLMNPYDELAKVRMVPMPDSSGMQLERLAPDSILARVGVAQGDVISAVNGVQITNVADAANALNSMMSGSRFDVTVMRGGKPLELRYQVK